MVWIREQLPGKTDAEIRKLGNELKNSIRATVKTGVVTPEFDAAKIAAQATAPIEKKVGPVITQEALMSKPELSETQSKDIVEAQKLIEERQQTERVVNEDNTVNIEKLYEGALLNGDKLVPKVGVMGKFLDAVTNTFDPKTAKSEWRRAMGRTFASVRKVIGSFGEVGNRIVNTFDEITHREDTFSAKAKESAGKFVDYVKKNLTPEENQEQKILRIKNNVANAKAEGRNKIRTADEVIAQSPNPKVKEALRLYYEAVKEISQALNSKWYRVNGQPAYKAGEPSLFHPRDYGKNEIPDNTFKINELAKEMVSKDPDLTMRKAEADARAQIENQQAHSSKTPSGYGVTKAINTIEDAIEAGFELDDARALEYFINKNSKAAAIMDVLGKKGIYETSDIKDTQDTAHIEDEARKAVDQYYKQIKDDFAKEIDNYVNKEKFSPREGQAFREVLEHYMEFSFKGGDIGKLWNVARKVQALKLGTSGINNFFQPFLNLLKGDFPSFTKGVRAAWTRSASPEFLSRIRESRFGYKDINDLTIQSGTKQHQYLETPQETTGETLLDKATKVTGFGLKTTETGNRQGASVAAFDFAYRAEKMINDPNVSITKKISLANDLTELIGREVKVNEPLQLTKTDMNNAMYNFTKATQFGYDPLNLPHWANTGWGKAIFQFKSFVYNSTRLTFESTIGELQQGNTGRATRNFLVMSLLFPLPGEAIRAFRHYVLGSQTKDDQNLMSRWFNDIGEIVGLGFLDSVINSPDGYSFITNIVGGPTATTAAQAFDWITKTVPELGSGEIGKSLESTFKFTSKQIGGFGTALRNINQPR